MFSSKQYVQSKIHLRIADQVSVQSQVLPTSVSLVTIIDMLNDEEARYMEEDRSPMLYSITFSFLAAAVCIVMLR